MIIDPALADVDPLRAALRADIRADETEIVRRLATEAALPEDARERVARRARALVEEVRRARVGKGGLDAFLHEFGLTSKEGVVLMCLAEALLRVPDAETVDKLIRDKLAEADWRAHLGHSESLFVNASTWALMLTGRVVRLDAADTRDLACTLKRLVHNSGEPMIRGGIETILGVQVDPVFGPAVMFGLGGVFVEILGDVAFRLAPFGLDEANRMIREIEGFKMLAGVRGAPPVDIEALAEALVRLSVLADVEAERIEGIDVNPFLVLPEGQGAVALDALVVPRAVPRGGGKP